jgi:ethanolamine-phosphate phospho-lyase
MANSILNSHNIDAIESKSDEPEFDFKEYYSREKTLALRDVYIPYCTELFYRGNPIKIVRCQGTFMYDQLGNKYLDCINNVAHVGHCHPYVVTQTYKQMGACATNNRYLHDNTVILAEKISKTLPKSLEQIFYTNSGSEANDLALRLAREYTGNYDILVLDNAYHGHLTTLVELSTYKFKKANTTMKAPEHVHVLPTADIYRGKYRDVDYNNDEEKLCQLYVNEVHQVVEEAESRGRRIAIFLIESFQSCGGQIIYPKGYLKQTFNYLQSKGILCLVDEVQTGFGRSGTHYWAFQSYEEDIVPDFVTMGKSMGNGFPVAALVTRRDITQKFDIDGIEYFNTYGGNPVSCRAAIAVMDVVENEKLMEHARTVGNYLLHKLKEIGQKYDIIGDVRGRGLFIGIEIVRDAKTREVGIEEAREIKYKLREHMIIISLDGPDHNVVKFKSPMCFSIVDADFLCEKFEIVVKECQKKKDEKQQS